jgi:hypothetical protein
VDPDRREELIARNEVLFREVNERVREVSVDITSGPIDFLCECGNGDCTDTIPLTRTEYERIRSDPELFVVKPGHGTADLEHVVAEDERFQVVRKHEEEAQIARETDPRR